MFLRHLKSNPALALFAAAFFLSPLDLALTLKAAGFTLKAYQGLSLLCAATLLWRSLRDGRLERHLAPLRRAFALAALALAFFYLGISPWSAFPAKSFLYSCWLLFDITALWLSVQLLFDEAPAEFFAQTAFLTLLFTSVVILIDYAAYPFGYGGGLVGFNQDAVTHLGVSRPHAFTSEPSYAASFLCLGFLTVAPFRYRHARRKALTGAGLAVIMFALVATTSRSGWAALAFGLGLLAILPILGGKRIPWRTILPFFGAVPVVVAVFLFTMPRTQRENLQSTFVTKVFQGNDSSGNSRLKALRLSVDYAWDTHGIGTGLGASYRYYKDHGGYDSAALEGFNPRQFGNEVIMSTWGQLLAEGGPVALLLYGLAGFFLVRALLRAWKKTNSTLAYGSLVATIVFFFFSAFLLGNVCRGDVWVWFGLWSGFAVKAAEPA